MDIEILLTLKVNEINLIIAALQNAPLPMVQSSPLLQKIQQQAIEQTRPPIEENNLEEE